MKALGFAVVLLIVFAKPAFAGPPWSAVYPVSIYGTYLRTSEDPKATAPLSVNLSSLSISPGDSIALETSGFVTFCVPEFQNGCPTSNPNLVGAFTAGAMPSSSNVIATDRPQVGTDPTHFNQLVTDIPNDFAIGIRSTTVYIVPSGATTLWIALPDSHYSDNGGFVEVRIYKLKELDAPGIPLNVRWTFLRTEQDLGAQLGNSISLSGLNIRPGDSITLQGAGGVNYCEPDASCASPSPSLIGAFTTGGSPANGVLDAGLPQFTSQSTYYGHFPTDIANDFHIAADQPITVKIPENAVTLWVTLNDRIWSDNSGEISVRIGHGVEIDIELESSTVSPFVPKRETLRTVAVTAALKDGDTPVPATDIVFTIKGKDLASAGHAHGLLSNLTFTFVDDQNKVITPVCRTNQDGACHVKLLVPEVSGIYTIKGALLNALDEFHESDLTVRFEGLLPLPVPGHHYTTLVTDPTPHPNFAWGTPALITAAVCFADKFWESSGKFNVSFNDFSLPWGGLFDVSLNWTTAPGGHKSHRRGTSIDLNSTVTHSESRTTTKVSRTNKTLNAAAATCNLRTIPEETIHLELQ
jgi:hypothetical protein